jgi:hypothetical protein
MDVWLFLRLKVGLKGHFYVCRRNSTEGHNKSHSHIKRGVLEVLPSFAEMLEDKHICAEAQYSESDLVMFYTYSFLYTLCVYLGFLQAFTMLNIIFCQNLNSSFNVGACLCIRYLPQYIPDVFFNKVTDQIF